MNSIPAQLSPFADPMLIERCLELELPVITLDESGKLTARRVPMNDPVVHVVLESNLLRQVLKQSSQSWEQIQPGFHVELWSGLSAIPIPVTERRRVVGYQVALVMTPSLLTSEPFNRLIDQAGMDVQAAASQLAQLIRHSDDQVGTLASTLNWISEDSQNQAELERQVTSLSTQLSESYEEISLVYKLTAGMAVTDQPESFLVELLKEVHEVCGLEWVVMKLSRDEARLGHLTDQCWHVGRVDRLGNDVQRVAGDLLDRCNQDPHLAGIIPTDHLPISHQGTDAKRWLVVPIQGFEQPFGVIFGAGKVDGTELSTIDSKLVTSLAQNLSIYLRNAALYQDLQDTFMGMLRSLVNAIDAKDAYTCGHSERVAWLGRELARGCGLDEPTVERVYLSGLLHDVGKIGIPESVLTKDGRLSNDEFAIIKTHPRIGARIISDIRQMQDLVSGVMYHHERFDGKGYPDGLSGQSIPLFGRLLCLADSFDAMSSDRTYRSAWPLDKVLEEINNCSGTQFDPDLARVFAGLDFKPYFEMVADHRARMSLFKRELEASS